MSLERLKDILIGISLALFFTAAGFWAILEPIDGLPCACAEAPR